MSVEQAAAPCPEPLGWAVTDPDGNLVDSGPISQAQAAAWIGELLAEAERNQEGQE